MNREVINIRYTVKQMARVISRKTGYVGEDVAEILDALDNFISDVIYSDDECLFKAFIIGAKKKSAGMYRDPIKQISFYKNEFIRPYARINSRYRTEYIRQKKLEGLE